MVWGGEDGDVSGLESDSGRTRLAFGLELDFPFLSLSVLSLFMMQNQLKHLSVYSSRCSRSVDGKVR